MKRILAWTLVLASSVALVQARDDSDDDMPEESIGGKAALTIDNGGHVGVIGGMVFTPDGKKLVTVGHDWTIQEYDPATGRRIRVIRPPVGRTVGDRLNGVALIKGPGKKQPDGAVLAVAGSGIHADVGRKMRQLRLFLLQRDTGKIVPLKLSGLKTANVGLEALAGLPDLGRTASAKDDTILVHSKLTGLWRGEAEPSTPSMTLTAPAKRIRALAYSPDGKHLAATSMQDAGRLMVWNVVGKNAPKLLENRQVDNPALGVAWSPSGKWLATGHRARTKQVLLRLWSAPGKLEKAFDRDKLSRRLEGGGTAFVDQVVFRNEKEALLSVTWTDKASQVGNHLVLAFNVQTGTSRELLYQGEITTPHPGAEEGLVPLAISPNGNLAAVAVEPRGSRIAWLDLTGKNPPRFSGDTHGLRAPVAWSHDGTTIAWRMRGQKARQALNLKTLTAQPVPRQRDQFLEAIHEQGKWKVDRMGEPGKQYLQVKRDGKSLARVGQYLTRFDRFTLSPDRTAPWLAWSDRGKLFISNPATGTIRHQLRPFKSRILGLAPSPDGRYLLAASAREVLYVYRVAGTNKFLSPLLTVYPHGQDWIAWTAEGYYAATPGGERLMGWTVNDTRNNPATFLPAKRLSKQLRRPELISLVLAKGDVKAALAALPPPKPDEGKEGTRKVKVDDLLPPTVVIESVDTTNLPSVTVKVKATAGATSQPVMSMRLLVRGRPMSENECQIKLDKGKKEVEQTWKFTVEEGKNDLVVVARSPDSMGISEEKEVTFKQPPVSRLFGLCIGVNEYRDPKINLKAAVNDAKAVATALKNHCGKPLFAAVHTELLTDKGATRKAVLDALENLRTRGDNGKPLKASDLVVVFFAGHGVKVGKDFYLLTHEADISDSSKVPGTCISGTELRKALSAFRCQVLLMLDACHSGGALKGYSPATDEATRALTDEEVGVVVLSAAMGHEYALEKNGRGFFARAVEEAIARKPGVPFNFRDRFVYVHHLFSYTFDRVKDLSDDKQHPALNLPDTVESFPVVPE